MRKIFMSLLILLSTCVFAEQKAFTVINGENYNGKIQSCIMTTYYVSCNNLIQDTIITKQLEYTYDAAGNLIEQSTTDSTEKYSFAYTYDCGNVTSETTFDGNGFLSKKESYEYDQNGNKISEFVYDVDGTLNLMETYSYDKNGHQISAVACSTYEPSCHHSELSYDTIGYNSFATENHEGKNIDWKYVYTYDDHGNVLSKAYFENDHDLKWSYNYKYDNENRLIEQTQFGADNTIWWKAEYRYKNGKLSDEIFYKAKGYFNARKEYTYNKDGKIKTIKNYDRLNFLTSTKTYKYNRKGYVSHLIEKNLRADKKSYNTTNSYYEYVYDMLGNWIEKYEFEGDQIIKIYKQEILYYQPTRIVLN